MMHLRVCQAEPTKRFSRVVACKSDTAVDSGRTAVNNTCRRSTPIKQRSAAVISGQQQSNSGPKPSLAVNSSQNSSQTAVKSSQQWSTEVHVHSSQKQAEFAALVLKQSWACQHPVALHTAAALTLLAVCCSMVSCRSSAACVNQYK